ncbi:hypothetical protein AB5N19_10590 [Seiridium cardinale]
MRSFKELPLLPQNDRYRRSWVENRIFELYGISTQGLPRDVRAGIKCLLQRAGFTCAKFYLPRSREWCHLELPHQDRMMQARRLLEGARVFGRTLRTRDASSPFGASGPSTPLGPGGWPLQLALPLRLLPPPVLPQPVVPEQVIYHLVSLNEASLIANMSYISLPSSSVTNTTAPAGDSVIIKKEEDEEEDNKDF